jgi:hypothetical protein
MLEELDKEYRESEHTILDGHRMVGAGGVGNPWHEDNRVKKDGVEGKVEVDVDDAVMEMRAKDAMRVLENHIRDRMPFAQVASRRMQAVMGVKNEIVFGLSFLHLDVCFRLIFDWMSVYAWIFR